MKTTSTATTLRGYCRGCRTEGRAFRFSGYAGDGRENGVRPRAEHRSCMVDGFTVLRLGDLPDADGLVITVVRKGLISRAGDAKVDPDDAIGQLREELWKMYLRWRPNGITFTSYAAHWLPRKLQRFIGNATGDAGAARAIPKAHAASVSQSLDALLDDSSASGGSEPGGLAAIVRRGEAHAPHDRSGDLGWLRAEGDRGTLGHLQGDR